MILNSYDPAELLSATIGTLVSAFRWNKAQAGEFARLSAGWIITGVVSRNPLILVVSVVALARAYHLAQTRDDYAVVVDDLAKGTVVSGVTISAVAAIGVGTAVPGLGLLVGITTGVLAHKAADRVSVSEISRFIAERTMSAAEHIKTTAAQATPPPH